MSKKREQGFWVWTYEDYILVRSYVMGIIDITNEQGEKETYYKLTGHPHELLRSDICFKRQKDLIDNLKITHTLWLTMEEKYMLSRILDTVKNVKEDKEEWKETERKARAEDTNTN